MNSTTQIVAQLAPQRSTQYSSKLARDLAAAELLASPIGSGASCRTSRCKKLPVRTTCNSACRARSQTRRPACWPAWRCWVASSRPSTRSAASAAPFFVRCRSPIRPSSRPTWPPPVATRARPTKPSRTSFATWQSTRRTSPVRSGRRSMSSIRCAAAGPRCSRPCRWAPMSPVSMSTAPMSRARRPSSPSTVGRTASRSPPRRSACASSVRGAGSSRSAGTMSAAACWPLAMPDGPPSCSQGFGRPHLIVTDLPYGIQHSGPLHGLLADCLPGWAELLLPGGAIAF